jgi:hypothetical protein
MVDEAGDDVLGRMARCELALHSCRETLLEGLRDAAFRQRRACLLVLADLEIRLAHAVRTVRASLDASAGQPASIEREVDAMERVLACGLESLWSLAMEPAVADSAPPNSR